MKQSAEMWSALEFFATAQLCRELSVSVDSVVAGRVARAWRSLMCKEIGRKPRSIKNDVHHCRQSMRRVVKLRLPALGSVLTVFGTKNSSFVELECR